MDSLVALQVVVATKGLDALVALEGPFRLWLWLIVAVDHGVTTVALPNSHSRNHGHLATGLVHIRHDGPAHGWQLLIGAIRSVSVLSRDRTQAA